MKPADVTIAALAGAQHGVVTRRQLLAAGVGRDIIDRRVAAGSLLVLHRGVYRAGPIEATHARELAAALSCGSGGIVSHRSAAVLWQLLPRTARPAMVEVIDREGDHRREGVSQYRIRTVRAGEVTSFEGIPVTTPARTLYDLATIAAPRELERAVAAAFERRLSSPVELRKLLEHHGRRRGTGTLRAVLEAGAPALTRSEAEERFLTLVRQAQIAGPETNVIVHSLEVDFLWRAAGLVVEIDGFAYHSSAAAFERDRHRDAVLTAAGLRTQRVTWRQLEAEPLAVVARLAQALTRQTIQ